MLNLSIVLEDSARRHPDRPALVLGERALTYADVDATARPEQLGLEEWVRLAEVVALGDRGGAR